MEPPYVILSQKIYAIEIDTIDRLKRANIRPTVIDEFGSRMWKLMKTEFGLSENDFGMFVNDQDLPYNQILPFAKKVEDRIYQELEIFLTKESKNKSGNRKKVILIDAARVCKKMKSGRNKNKDMIDICTDFLKNNEIIDRPDYLPSQLSNYISKMRDKL
jgi:hypothetical protein